MEGLLQEAHDRGVALDRACRAHKASQRITRKHTQGAHMPHVTTCGMATHA